MKSEVQRRTVQVTEFANLLRGDLNENLQFLYENYTETQSMFISHANSGNRRSRDATLIGTKIGTEAICEKTYRCCKETIKSVAGSPSLKILEIGGPEKELSNVHRCDLDEIVFVVHRCNNVSPPMEIQ